ISPYLRHSFDAIASSELRYTHDEVRTRENVLSDSKGDSALFDLTSGQAFTWLGWGLHYSQQIIDYSNYPTAKTELSSVDLRFLITPKFSLIGTQGYEKYGYSIGQGSGGPHWTGGFSWTPSARTSIEYSTGYRFFGKTYSLAASHHSRNTVWSMNYSDDITTNRSEFLIPATIDTANFLDLLLTPGMPDPVLRKQFIDSFILNNGLPASLAENINYFSSGYFLQKRLQASVALNGTKSTLILSAYDSSRESLTSLKIESILGTSNLVSNDNTEDTGASAMWVWRLTPRTNINANTSYTISHAISTNITQRYWLTKLGMTRQLRPKLDGSVDLRRNESHSDQTGGGYLENAITASLLIQF
ncbi:MAG: TIGR03016 family PEP-CTERM system-associated outer membrane protein, partial [Gallionella sp.]